MNARSLGSLTVADLGHSIRIDGRHGGTLGSVRHFTVTGRPPSTSVVYLAPGEKVPNVWRETHRPSDTPCEVST